MFYYCAVDDTYGSVIDGTGLSGTFQYRGPVGYRLKNTISSAKQYSSAEKSITMWLGSQKLENPQKGSEMDHLLDRAVMSTPAAN